jgi:hypothetical protein
MGFVSLGIMTEPASLNAMRSCQFLTYSVIIQRLEGKQLLAY